MLTLDSTSLDWSKSDGMLPAIVQDADTGAVLMLAWMTQEALQCTLTDGYATFHSRSRKRLWRKGETSGNSIAVVEVIADCDRDTLLVRGRPVGPVCHTGTSNCFDTSPAHRPAEFLHTLEAIIEQRIRNPPATSYTAATYARGVARMAQKVGEEGLEVALAAVQSDRRALVSESADLVFHLLLLLRAEGLSLADVTRELQSRHSAAD
ncbi:MAG: bifunctional phosphoribosyl-AMP cyclohydrolase/phosphoribosyl-ATP diphosphatase HisIE [Pseudomonadota bacterium]